MNKRVVIKVKPFIYSLLLILLIFEDVISHYIAIANYYDEVIAIGLLLIYVVTIFRKKGISKRDVSIVFNTLVLLMFGFIGNSKSNVQNNLLLQIFDAFNIFKFVIAIIGGELLFNNIKNKKYVVGYTAFAVKFAVCVSSIFMAINLFADIGMHTDYRYGVRAYNFIFTRVGDFYSSCVLWIIVLTASLFYKEKRSTKFFIVLALINMCSSLRSRAWGFALLYVILYYAFCIRKEKKFKWWYLMPFALLIYFIAADQFIFYFTGDRARNVLLRYGIITAKNFFPVGSGFATYGTAIAQKNYSALYHIYNFSAYWGLSPQYGSFLTDNYWPAVMAEFGFIGAGFMALLIFRVIRKLVSVTDNPLSKTCVCFGFGTLLLASLASSSFFSCTALVIFLCLICKLNDEATITGNPNPLRSGVERKPNHEVLL